MVLCKSCKQEKYIGDFYAHPKATNGLDSTCKECRKHRVRENRRAKLEYYRNYDRYRYKNDPKVKERHKRYQNTDRGKEASRRAKNRYVERNPIKRAAHIMTGNAVKDGRLSKPDYCEGCGSKPGRLHGHHDDYAKPLEVRWLCPTCHVHWHDENGEGANAQ